MAMFRFVSLASWAGYIVSDVNHVEFLWLARLRRRSYGGKDTQNRQIIAETLSSRIAKYWL